MRALASDSICLTLSSKLGIKFANPISLYRGEWVYITPKELSFLDGIVNQNLIDTDLTLTMLGHDVDNNLSVDTKQFLRSKISYIHGQIQYPKGLSIEEEIKNNLLIKSSDNKLSFYNSILKQYNLDKEYLCDTLNISQRIILDIIIAIESNPSILILDNVINYIDKEHQELVLAEIHHKSLSNGMTVILSTYEEAIKQRYLGRELLDLSV